MLKNLIKRALHSVGLELKRLSPSSNPQFQLLKNLEVVGVDLVFDIGANVGQFAQSLRSVGYTGGIVSFEPLSTAHKTLCKKASSDPRWSVHPRTAVGDTDGAVEINIAGNSVSSSLLPMLDSHSGAAANSGYVASELTPIARLDTVAPQYLSPNSKYFLKIDTQGFEWAVLNGAAETLKEAAGVLCELSLVPLYEGQYLWRDVVGRLEEHGFTLWAIQQGFTDPHNGRSLQIDAIFLRV